MNRWLIPDAWNPRVAWYRKASGLKQKSTEPTAMALRWCGLTSDSHLIEPHVTQDWRRVIAVSAVAVGSEVVSLNQCFLGFWWLASVSSYHVCGCKSDCVKSTVSPFFFPRQKQKCLVRPVFFFLFEVVSVSQCLVDHFFLFVKVVCLCLFGN